MGDWRLRNGRAWIRDQVEYERRARIQNPYGDGKASARIVAAIRVFFAELEPAHAGSQ